MVLYYNYNIIIIIIIIINSTPDSPLYLLSTIELVVLPISGQTHSQCNWRAQEQLKQRDQKTA